MKCLSVRQPFAWAILKGIKTVENRTERFPDHEGPVLIHAGKVREKLDGKFVDGTPVPQADELPLGAIVGAGLIVAMWPWYIANGVLTGEVTITHEKDQTIITTAEDAVAFPRVPDLKKKMLRIAKDPFTSGPLCLLFDNPIEFEEPVPWTGQVGLVNVDEKKLALSKGDRRRLDSLVTEWGRRRTKSPP